MEKLNEFILSEEQKQKTNVAKQIMKQILDMEGVFVYQEKIVSIISNLKKIYSDAENYFLYHILIGSSVHDDKCLYYDFPGDDSILKKLQNELEAALLKFEKTEQ
jgi:hypothetical protein